MHSTPPAQRAARTVFSSSRLLEFCSAKELTTQTGHPPELWPVVVIRELVDNALDAAEEGGIAPHVTVAVDKNRIIVADNGTGITTETVGAVLDYSVRASSREAFVSPTRGAQGNGLKVVLAMAFALTRELGITVIEARGVAHKIAFRADPIAQRPEIEVERRRSSVKTGTKIIVNWPSEASSKLGAAQPRILQLAAGYTWLNPHLSFGLTWNDKRLLRHKASDSAWTKWRPSDPIPAHWYDGARFERRIAAQVRHDQDHGRNTMVREFISEFRGLTGTAKQSALLDELGLARVPLAEFFAGNDRKRIARLHALMVEQSNPVKPSALGIIGKNSLVNQMVHYGAEEDSCRYKQVSGETDDGLPFIVEAAFGWAPRQPGRALILGTNFSPAIGNPFRSLNGGGNNEDDTDSAHGDGGLEGLLSEQWAGSDEPIIVALHATCPRFKFTDRGKSAISLPPEIANSITEAVTSITQKWAKQLDAEYRRASREEARAARLSGSGDKGKLKRAAWEVMEEAYMMVSDNDTLPANARQIMYAARDYIQAQTGEQLRSNYFTQVLLPDYLAVHDVEWDVVYDDRGHFTEPHTGLVIGLGTLNVRKYLKAVQSMQFVPPAITGPWIETRGPHGRFGAILFVEKEGFDPILEHVNLAARYDLGLMSTKGMSVTASRALIDGMAGLYPDVPILILHDFDKSGFSIIGTAGRSNRRYQFVNRPNIVDLGLRLADVQRLGLQGKSESVFDRGDKEVRRANLIANGATEEEADFLLTRRVELNAMSSRQFVDYVEAKLVEHGVRKVIPNPAVLAEAYQHFHRGVEIAAEIAELLERRLAEENDAPVGPRNLDDQVAAYLRENPTETWDIAVEAIVRGHAR